MARYRTSGPNRWFTFDGTEYYPDDTGWITPPNAAVESAMINAGLIADCVPQINPAGQIIDPRTQSPVSGAPITDAQALSGTGGAAVGEVRVLSDGPNSGTYVRWFQPSGSSTPTWCWDFHPQTRYEG